MLHDIHLCSVPAESVCICVQSGPTLRPYGTVTHQGTVACQAPLSMGIFQARILKWVSFPSPGDLPQPGTEPEFPALTGGPLGFPSTFHLSNLKE